MYNYSQIDELFGTPLNAVPKPHIPFRMRTWHWVGIGIIFSLAVYGGVCLYRRFGEYTSFKKKKD